MRILVVCTANVCRSPMGAALLQHRCNELGVDVTVSSAGVQAHELPVVASVAGRTLRGPKCLIRSMVAWFLLRRRGFDAVLRLGVPVETGGPFEAHGWVEMDGVVLWEPADIQERFGPFDLQLPRLTPAVTGRRTH